MSTVQARMRILETTDLHMQILPYDYFADHPVNDMGLTLLADIIHDLRAEGIPCLLFDNGDFMQGNPMADIAAAKPLGTPHPMMTAMNLLDYDAICLGNHEFNYGLPLLRRVISQSKAPVLSANAHVAEGPRLADKSLLLSRMLCCNDKTSREVTIGVFGLTPPQVVNWDHFALKGQIRTEDMVVAAKRQTDALKAQGAEIIVALCHAGISDQPHVPMMENAARSVAAICGVDVILTGHTHNLFPTHAPHNADGIDPDRGTLHCKPAVMAGHQGSHLGVIELTLGHDPSSGWSILGHKSQTIAARQKTTLPTSPKGRAIVAATHDIHRETVATIRETVARTEGHLHSFFANVSTCNTQTILAEAQMGMAQHIPAHFCQGRPVLSAVTAYRAGGHGGPANYVDIPPGLIALRDAAAIMPYQDTICAVVRSGADIRYWLEVSAALYRTLIPGQHLQPLINPHCPSYQSDIIYGLTYDIDLTRPALFDENGAPASVADTRGRVVNLRHNGRPVAGNESFILMTNSFRCNGGGGHLPNGGDHVIWGSTQTLRDVLIAYLQRAGAIQPDNVPVRSFAPIGDTSATYDSATAAVPHLCDTNLRHLGPTATGFQRFCITL